MSMEATSSGIKTVKVYAASTNMGWVFDTYGTAPGRTEIEVGEATYASWEHARIAYIRMQYEIEDMVHAKRETA